MAKLGSTAVGRTDEHASRLEAKAAIESQGTALVAVPCSLSAIKRQDPNGARVMRPKSATRKVAQLVKQRYEK